MASIAKRPDGRWRARYRDEAGKEHARHFDRKLDAQRWLDEVTASVLTGRYVDPRAGKVTFREYAVAWQGRQVHRVNTRNAVDSALRVHAFPRFGSRPIASIRPSEVQAWVKDLSERMAPSTVRTTYQHVRSVFRAAELDRVIARTPCERINLPEVVKDQVVPLATDLVLAIERLMPARWAAMVTLMAGTGLRPGEAAGLTLDRVDFLRRTLLVDRQLLLVRRPHVFGPPKTRASVRTVPMPQVVVDALAAHLVEFPAGEHGLIFTGVRGQVPNRDDMARAFKAAALTAGAPASTRLHDLRHYYASLLIRHGESVKVVQARLGHGSSKETLDTYSHLWPDSEDMTRAAIDEVLGAAQAADEAEAE